MSEVFATFLSALPTLFFLVDPCAALPVLLTMTRHASPAERRAVARTAALVSTVILLVFAATGEVLLKALGLTFGSIKAAGGVLLLRTAFEMMRQGPSPSWPPDGEGRASVQQLGWYPLAVPLLSGPAAIAGSTSLAPPGADWSQTLAVLAAILVTGLLTWLVLGSAAWIERRLPPAALAVLGRLTGLVLAALAMELGASGLRELLHAG